MAGGLRPQAYVHNPMEWVDPLGLVGYPGVDFTGSDALYPSGNNIVTIKMTGSRYGDFKADNAQAGYKSSSGNFTGKSHPDNYTWHHLDDYDSNNNTSTMQLIRRDVHEASYSHTGSVSQFEKEHGVKYESKEVKLVAKSYNSKNKSVKNSSKC